MRTMLRDKIDFSRKPVFKFTFLPQFSNNPCRVCSIKNKYYTTLNRNRAAKIILIEFSKILEELISRLLF